MNINGQTIFISHAGDHDPSQLNAGGGVLQNISGRASAADSQATLTLYSNAASSAGLNAQCHIADDGSTGPVTSRLLEVAGSAAVQGNVHTQSAGAEEVLHYVGGTNALGTTFGAAWGNLGGTSAKLAFRRVASPPNCTQISGVIATTGTAPNNVIFTLPLAYRPASDYREACATASFPAAACLIQVSAATGDVQISGAPGSTATTIGFSKLIPRDQ